MNRPTVYIDTNVLKFSATQLPRYIPKKQEINWGGNIFETTVHDIVEINPNGFIKNPKLKKEADLLEELADHGKRHKVNFVMQMESQFESWGLPNMDSSSGIFYGAPIEKVDAPIKYGRILFGSFQDSAALQYDFLSTLEHSRFIEIQKITGAYQGNKPKNRNQLLDAFHIWCAEHNNCDYFLTLDFKLIRMLKHNNRANLLVNLIRPSCLLDVLNDS